MGSNNAVMEEVISGAIVRRYFRKLEDNLAIDVAIVGAGPSGLVAAHDLAKAGLKVAVYESKLAPGGGTWGGGMLFNEVTVQNDAAEILHEFGITTVPYDDKYHTVDSVEMASGLIFGARKAGATIFNTVKVEDIVMHDGVVSGVVINWNPVARLEMHVDPIVVTTRALIDGTGQRGLDHIEHAFLHSNESDDQFSGIAERGVQKTSDLLSRVA